MREGRSGDKLGHVRMPKLVEGVDYYMEDGKFVLTAEYHLRRGHCCNSGCRHCPYKDDPVPTPFKVRVDVPFIVLPGKLPPKSG